MGNQAQRYCTRIYCDRPFLERQEVTEKQDLTQVCETPCQNFPYQNL